GSKRNGDWRFSRKKRLRSETFSTLAFPFTSVAVRKAERKSRPRNLATSRPCESRKIKSPSLRLTRCTSGAEIGEGVAARILSLGEVVLAAEVVAGATGTGVA